MRHGKDKKDGEIPELSDIPVLEERRCPFLFFICSRIVPDRTTTKMGMLRKII